jgi:hypothetical protein
LDLLNFFNDLIPTAANFTSESFDVATITKTLSKLLLTVQALNNERLIHTFVTSLCRMMPHARQHLPTEQVCLFIKFYILLLLFFASSVRLQILEHMMTSSHVTVTYLNDELMRLFLGEEDSQRLLQTIQTVVLSHRDRHLSLSLLRLVLRCLQEDLTDLTSPTSSLPPVTIRPVRLFTFDTDFVIQLMRSLIRQRSSQFWNASLVVLRCCSLISIETDKQTEFVEGTGGGRIKQANKISPLIPFFFAQLLNDCYRYGLPLYPTLLRRRFLSPPSNNGARRMSPWLVTSLERLRTSSVN